MKLFTVIVVAALAITGIHLADRHPPHVERPAAAATSEPSLILGTHPGDLIAFFDHLRGQHEPDQNLEPAPTPEPAPTTRPADQTSPPPGLPDTGCDGHVIPGWILMRESRCNYDAYNAGGCGGYGCIGLYQIDARHFTGWANGQAGCGDLDPWTVDGQDECAARLSRGGTYLAPWGG